MIRLPVRWADALLDWAGVDCSGPDALAAHHPTLDDADEIVAPVAPVAR